MRTFLRIHAAALAGVLLVASAGIAPAQTTGGGGSGGAGGGGGGGSSMGGAATGGSGMGGSSLSGGTGLGSSLIGANASGFLSSAGTFLSNSPTATSRTSSFFSSGTNNSFAQYYTNPLTTALGSNASASVGGSAGLRGSGGGYGGGPGGGGTGGFGMPLYANLSNNTTNTMPGVTGSIRSPGLSSGSGRVPAFTAAVDFAFLPPTPSQVQVDLQAMLARSSVLRGAAIRVEREGPTVVLRGTVGDDRTRRLAENMVRLTPGVRDVRNELNVR